MAKNDYDYFQCNFRLNLNNPNHLKIYRVFEDLNKDIHKSRTNFIIEALLAYITEASSDKLTKGGAEEMAKREGYVTRKEFDGMENRVTAKVMKEVAEFMSKAAFSSQGMMVQMLQPVMQMGNRQKATKPETEEQTEAAEGTDKTLEEMALLFSNGSFGEE